MTKLPDRILTKFIEWRNAKIDEENAKIPRR